jgi:hypothetical protein
MTKINQQTKNDIISLSRETSQTNIAKKYGIAVSTVNKVLRQSPGYDKEQKLPFSKGRIISRCHTCGGMVLMPCLACEIRKGIGSNN